MRAVFIPKGTLVGFKALPTNDINQLNDRDRRKSDWSAIYPQLWFPQAVNYLSNQWERGNTSAVIVSLYCIKPINILVLDDSTLCSGVVDSVEKARLVRVAYDSFTGISSDKTKPLLDCLGEDGFCLCIPDAENFELVVPHSMFTSTVLSSELLFTLEQSATRPCTVGKVLDSPCLAENRAQERSILADPVLLGRALSAVLAGRGLPVECTQLLQLLSLPSTGNT